MQRLTRPSIGIVSLLLMLSLSACLKTRAQLREEGSGGGNTSHPSSDGQIVQSAPPAGNYVMDELKSEVIRLSGRVDELERSQTKGPNPDQATKEDLKKLEAKIQSLEQAQQDAFARFAQAQREQSLSRNPESLFQEANSLLEAGDYAQAVEKLDLYLKQPKATHIQDATFLKGEAHYRLKEYKRAIVEYSKFPEKYKKSKHMPASLFKIGLCFEALGMKEDAKPFYQEILDKHPKAPEAKSARAKLK